MWSHISGPPPPVSQLADWQVHALEPQIVSSKPFRKTLQRVTIRVKRKEDVKLQSPSNKEIQLTTIAEIVKAISA